MAYRISSLVAIVFVAIAGGPIPNSILLFLDYAAFQPAYCVYLVLVARYDLGVIRCGGVNCHQGVMGSSLKLNVH